MIDSIFIGLETLPSLYGTKENRKRTKVRDASSGFVAGGKGLAFGFYDGLSGMVMDPMRGAQSDVSLSLVLCPYRDTDVVEYRGRPVSLKDSLVPRSIWRFSQPLECLGCFLIL